jgi:hypothetical protein
VPKRDTTAIIPRAKPSRFVVYRMIAQPTGRVAARV